MGSRVGSKVGSAVGAVVSFGAAIIGQMSQICVAKNNAIDRMILLTDFDGVVGMVGSHNCISANFYTSVDQHRKTLSLLNFIKAHSWRADKASIQRLCTH